MILPSTYFLQSDVVSLSRNLLGKILCSNIDGKYCSGLICETEAYAGVNDKASHAYNGRRTSRTETMYLSGGHCYVYLCYGIHYLFNVVSNKENIPHAILIRGIYPLEGLPFMQERRQLKSWDKNACIGPGKLSQALGISLMQNAKKLEKSNNVWIEDRGIILSEKEISKGKRIGIEYAEEDALLPYRFLIREPEKIQFH